MTHFSAWALAWALTLVVAFAAALLITYAPDRPSRREPIRVELAGLSRPSWDRPQAQQRQADFPVPAETMALIMPPVEHDDEPVMIRGAAQAVVVEVRTDLPTLTPAKNIERPEAARGRHARPRVAEGPRPPRWTPVAPSGVGVVPLWKAYEAAQRQAARLSALEPDGPTYTYEGAHKLAA